MEKNVVILNATTSAEYVYLMSVAVIQKLISVENHIEILPQKSVIRKLHYQQIMQM